MEIIISDEIKKLTPNFYVGVIECDVTIYEEVKIDELINNLEYKIQTSHQIEEIVNLPIIKDGRDAYKTYGKDPSRYRLATESLYRRLVKGNRLYRINNVVDLGNILSIETRKSIAVLDAEKIKGNITIRLGNENDEYYGIGRGEINIANIPLYEDEIGPFGSVTSDTERTMISTHTSKVLIFIISFSGKSNLNSEIDFAMNLYRKFAKATNFHTRIL